jgi:putative N6-adenine-specific DNA methylase
MEFEYQKYGCYFAQVAGQMEALGAQELKGFGVKDIRQVYRGVWFKTTLDKLYRINYRSRLISRVLAPLVNFDCHSTKYLYKTAVTIPWGELLKPDQTFAIFAHTNNSKITHSRYAAQVLKDAIVDYFRESTGQRPSIDRENPDLWLNLYIENNHARISVDTSGGPLHKRGYRIKSVAAPMQETLAAAIIQTSGWQGKVPLLDPMCGSGTLLCEAALHYCRVPSAYRRQQFGFMQLPDFDEQLWAAIVADGERLIRPLPKGLISGCDINAAALDAAATNCQSIPHGEAIGLKKGDFRNHPGLKKGMIVCNPPYGIRLGTPESLKKLYGELGDFFKQKCTGSTAYVYCGNRELISSIGLKPQSKIPLVNGQLDGRLLKFELY